MVASDGSELDLSDETIIIRNFYIQSKVMKKKLPKIDNVSTISEIP